MGTLTSLLQQRKGPRGEFKQEVREAKMIKNKPGFIRYINEH